MIKRYGNYIIIVLIMLFVFQIYLYTTFPAFKSNDSPETITAAYTLGIGHPPSYPLYTLMAKIFTHIPVGSPAFRVNLFSIVLSIILLIMTYLIIRQAMYFIFNYENKYINILCVLILGFSYIFWNQAIEAKGGIYILNLLLLAVSIYLILRMKNNFKIKYLYLLAYLYGLSLTNHWPSMIILLPVFGYVVFSQGLRMTGKNLLISLALFILGMSIYAYLPIRAGTDGIFVFKVLPNTWDNFWWTIFRAGYANDAPGTGDIYKMQILEFFSLTNKNFLFLWIFALPGIYALYKKRKDLAYFFTSILLVNAFAVIFINKTIMQLLWTEDIFLLPSLFIVFLLLVAGIYFIFERIKVVKFKNVFLFIVSALVVLEGFINFNLNNSRRNFLSYDYGNNVLKTMEPGCFYFSLGDYYAMPLIYFDAVSHTMNNITFQPLFNMEYKLSGYEKKFGVLAAAGQTFKSRFYDLVNRIKETNNVYLSEYPDNPNESIGTYFQRMKGLLIVAAKSDEHMNDNIYKIYSYRGMYDSLSLHDDNLVYNYSDKMNRLATEYLTLNKYNEAIRLYKKILLFPLETQKIVNTYFNMAIVYMILEDKDSELNCYKKIIEVKPDTWYAYEQAGKIYYKDNLLPIARDMFENAIKYGTKNKSTMKEYLKNIETANMNEQYAKVFNDATNFMNDDKFSKAMDLFEFLIKKKYDLGTIYRNVGVYYYKAGKYEDSIIYLQKSIKISKAPELYLSLASAYYNVKNKQKALSVIKEGMDIYRSSVEMQQMYNQIQQKK